MDVWHQRMNHISQSTVNKFVKEQLAVGITLSETKGTNRNTTNICVGLPKGKMARRRKTKRVPKTPSYLETIHFIGPMPTSAQGNKYAITFKDEKSGRSHVYFMKRRSEALEKFKCYKAEVEKTDKHTFHPGRHEIKSVQTDGAGEYVSREFKHFCASVGIRTRETNADEPRQNGRAERHGRTIQEAAMAMLKHSKQPIALWPYAFRTANYVYNDLPSRTLHYKSPNEVCSGTKSNLSSLRTFGCDAMVRVASNDKRKGGDKARKCLFLGYKEGLEGWVFKSYDTGRIIKSGDATFHEGEWLPQGIQRLSNSETQETTCYRDPNNTFAALDDGDDSDEDPNDETNDPPSADNNEDEETTNVSDAGVEDDDGEIATGPTSPTAPFPAMTPRADMLAVHRLNGLLNEERTLRSKATRQRRTNCNYKADYSAFQAQAIDQFMEQFALQATADPDIPMTREEAISGPDAAHWIAAMEDELKSHQENGTWGEETTLPTGRTCVGTKWLFKIKRDKDGNILRYKARFVAKGFSQKPGQDFNKTFAPVMQTSLLRSLFALAAEEDWECDHVDVKTAFLYDKVDEEIYIHAPDGTIRRLYKAIYGLRQAGRQWYNRFHKSFERFGMKRCESDPCCYVLEGSITPLIAVIHVDDCLIFGSDKSLVAKLKESLKEEYQISDLGPIKFALGWRIKRDRKRRLMTVNQQRYIIEITK